MSNYGKLTVVKLKELLKDRSLPVTGKKADLVERLQTSDDQLALDLGKPQSCYVEDVAQAKSADESKEPAPIVNQIDDASPTSPEQDAIQEIQAKDAMDIEQIANSEIDSKSEPSEPSKEGEEEIELPKEIVASNDQEDGEKQASKDSDEKAQDRQSAASQIPQSSIETQQTQESSGDIPQPIDIDVTSEPIIRSTTFSTLNAQEILEDNKKRKRRSQSPPASSADVALKKAKAVDGSPIVTSVQEEKETIPTQDDMQVDEVVGQDENKLQHSEAARSVSDNRFKNLIPTNDSSTQKIEPQPVSDDRSIGPSRHSPTKCLYISNLMRPLQQNALRTHLETLAASSTSDTPEEVDIFFLESTRRYCLVSLSSVAAASRVRSGLHDRVWPDESNRKALFVDFLPEEKANELITLEEQNVNKSRLDRKRYEITYIERNNEQVAEIHDADSPTAAQHRNNQDTPTPAQHTKQNAPITTTTATTIKPSPLPPLPHEETGKNFKQLNDLFPSTIAKPRLYYLPLSSEIVKSRLDMLSRATSGGASSLDILPSDEKRRYTFDGEGGEGFIVDKGPEFGYGRGGGGIGGGGRARGGIGRYSDRGTFRGRGRGGGHRVDYRSGAGIGYRERW